MGLNTHPLCQVNAWRMSYIMNTSPLSPIVRMTILAVTKIKCLKIIRFEQKKKNILINKRKKYHKNKIAIEKKKPTRIFGQGGARGGAYKNMRGYLARGGGGGLQEKERDRKGGV